MISFVHSADLHLGSDFGLFDLSRSKILKKSLKNAFSQMIAYCNLNKIDVIFLSGDIFDSPKPNDEYINFFTDTLAKLKSTKAFIALGNHDYGIELTGENIHVFSTKGESIFLPDLNLEVVGISFGSQYEPVSLIKNLNPRKTPSVLCVHGCIDGELYNPMPKRELFEKGFSYCALGHIHSFSTEKAGTSLVGYSGCIMGRGFDEQGEKGFVSGKIDSFGNVSIEFVPVPSYFFEEININISEIKTLKERLSPFGLYRINVGESDIPEKSIEQFLSENAFYCDVKCIGLSESPFIKLLKDELKDNPTALKYAVLALNGRSDEI